jgi:hypothetical protein
MNPVASAISKSSYLSCPYPVSEMEKERQLPCDPCNQTCKAEIAARK